MLRSVLLLCAGLLLASGAHAAPALGGRGGSFGRAPGPSVRSAGRPGSYSAASARPGAVPRGGPGTLGSYLGRPPSSPHHRHPGSYYPGYYYPGYFYPGYYYPGGYGGSLVYPYFYDPYFYPGTGYFSYGPDYSPAEDWSSRGNVQLHIDPKDVEVTVDGIPTANSGRAVLSLPTGVHHFVITHPGYRPWTVDLDVQQGVQYRLTQRLERLSEEEPQSGAGAPASQGAPPAGGLGELRLTVRPADTIVHMDGRLLGMADLLQNSLALHTIPLGRHILRFTRPGYQTVERQIDITADRPAEVSVDLKPD
jgi:hypothetical protein